VSPRARRTLLEGAPCWAALVGREGHHGVGCAVCVRFVLCSRSVCVLCFLQVLSRIPPILQETQVAVPDSRENMETCRQVRITHLLSQVEEHWFPEQAALRFL
jgi:hypothetical protein